MWTTPVAKTDSAPRYSATWAIVDRWRAGSTPAVAERAVGGPRLIGCSSGSGDECRNGSLQRGGLLVPERSRGRGDHHRARACAGRQACDLAIAGLRGRVGVDDARPAPGAKVRVARGGDEALAARALALVVPGPEAAPVGERLRALLRRRVQEAVNLAARAPKRHRGGTGVGLDRSPSGRVGEAGSACRASDLPTRWRRGRVQPG